MLPRDMRLRSIVRLLQQTIQIEFKTFKVESGRCMERSKGAFLNYPNVMGTRHVRRLKHFAPSL